MAKKDNLAGRLILGGFALGLVVLVIWFVLEFSGLMPGDVPVLPSEDSASVLPNADAQE